MRSSRSINSVLVFLLLLAVAGVIWLYTAYDNTPPAMANAEGEAVAVRVEQIQPQRFADTIEALGTTLANQSIVITSQVTNSVTDIHFTQGEKVSQGELLVTLENAEASADLAAAQATLVDSRTQYERSLQLSDSGAISASQLQQLEAQMRADAARVEAARARLANHSIRAPFSGRTGLTQISVGTLMQPGTVITTLDDINPIWLDFSVPEVFIGTLKPGQTISAHSVAYPERNFTGTVQNVDTRVNSATRTLTLRAEIANPDNLLKPGMFLSVDLLRNASQVLLIPEQAVLPEGDKQYVFIVADGKAHKREITTGRRQPGVVEITSGLKAGESIIVSGLLKVHDNSPIKLADAAPGSVSKTAVETSE